MDKKLEITVGKTIEALARVERFIEKYGEKLDKESVTMISNKIKELGIKVGIIKNSLFVCDLYTDPYKEPAFSGFFIWLRRLGTRIRLLL